MTVGGFWTVNSARYALESGWDCDVFREWVVSQYIRQGTDPWRLSHDILKLNFGPPFGANRQQLKRRPIFEVHPHLRTDGVAGIIPELGAPTATYIPSGMLAFTLLVGFIPRPALIPVWLGVNILAMVVLAGMLTKWLRRVRAECDDSGSPVSLSSFDLALSALLILLWPPCQEILRTSQFVFVIVVMLLLGFRFLSRNELLAGLFFGAALFKPHVALPFFVLPLVRGKWRTIVVAGAVHLLGLLGIAWWLKTAPWVLLSNWLSISPYLFQGAYTIQEVINRLNLDGTLLGPAMTLLFIGLCAAWVMLNRRARSSAIVGFLSFASVLWMYHERYDFGVLLIPLAGAVGLMARERNMRPGFLWAVLPAFILLGVGLSDFAYLQSTSIAHVLRWGGRIALYGLFLWFAGSLRSFHRRDTLFVDLATGGST